MQTERPKVVRACCRAMQKLTEWAVDLCEAFSKEYLQ
jgi:hypothetical protein